jgi:hypothetical protein
MCTFKPHRLGILCAVLMPMLARPPHLGLSRSPTHYCAHPGLYFLPSHAPVVNGSKPILTLLTGAFALSAVRPRILHVPQSLHPRALFKSLSNHEGCAIKAVRLRSHNQGRTIKAAAKAAHSRPFHTQASRSLAQNRSLKGQGRSLKAIRPFKAGARA